MQEFTSPQEALRYAVEKAGGAGATARALGLRASAVSMWFIRGIPADWCVELELLTGVKRSQLRPDKFGPIQRIRAARTQTESCAS